MFQNMFVKIKQLDKKTKITMKYVFISAFIVSIISSIILYTYQNFYSSPDLYYIGLQIFKISLTIAVSSFVCGLAVDTIKNEIAN